VGNTPPNNSIEVENNTKIGAEITNVLDNTGVDTQFTHRKNTLDMQEVHTTHKEEPYKETTIHDEQIVEEMNVMNTRHDSEIEFETETSDMTNFETGMSDTTDNTNIGEEDLEGLQNGQVGNTATHGYNL